MPTLTRFHIKSAFLWLAAAMTLGIVLALAPIVTLPGWVVYLSPAFFHLIMVGWVTQMIFGHAPLIFPSVLGRPMAYLPAFYGPLVVLHASLILRIASDLLNIVPLRQWGSLLNGVALLLFLGFTGLALGRGRN